MSLVAHTLIPELRRQTQVVSIEFEASLLHSELQSSQGYKVRPCVQKVKRKEISKPHTHKIK